MTEEVKIGGQTDEDIDKIRKEYE